MEYCAMVNIGVPGYGRLTPGEFLDEKCKEALGEEALDDLVKRGALRAELYEQPKPQEREGAQAESPKADEPEESNDAQDAAGDDGEAEALELDTMDDVVDDAVEPEPSPTDKPKKKRGAASDSQNQPSAVAKGDLETRRVSNLGGRKAK